MNREDPRGFTPGGREQLARVLRKVVPPKISEVLERARSNIAGGWHEPLSLASDGTICDAQAEGIALFCCHDALLVAARDDVDAFLTAEAMLAKVLRLDATVPSVNRWGHAMTPNEWAAEPKRTHADVLRLFARAIAHARAGE